MSDRQRQTDRQADVWTKQRIHNGRIPEHCDGSKTKAMVRLSVTQRLHGERPLADRQQNQEDTGTHINQLPTAATHPRHTMSPKIRATPNTV